MRKIIKNEWLYYIRTKWLLGVSVGFILILMLSILLGNYLTQKQTEQYNTAKQEMRQEWESLKPMNPHGAAHYGTYIFKPTDLLSSLDEGVNSITGNVLKVEGHVQNEILYSEASQMQAISKFGKLKSSLLLQYIIPVLLIFLAYSSISNEKRSGRLKLLLLQGAKSSSLIFAKTLSIWFYGLGLLALTIFAYMLFNLQDLDSHILSRTGMFFLSYSLYYFIITGLTVFFSARWQNATIALTSMLGIWILWTIFLPNILMSSVEKWHNLPNRTEFKEAMRDDRSKGIDGHNPRDERSKILEKEILAKYEVDSVSQLPIDFNGIRMQADEEYGNIVWDKHFGKLRKILTEQKQKYQLGGILNPFISLQNASMGFTASDNLHHQDFLVQAENYRRSFIKLLNDKQAYGGAKTGDWGWAVDKDFYKTVPDYEHKSVSLSSVFKHYTFDMILLVSWVILVILLISLGTKKIRVL